MGLLDWFRFKSTRGAIMRQGTEQAKRFGSTCEFVAQEFIKRNGLNNIPRPVWESCLRSGTCPTGLTGAVRDLLSAHAVDGAQEYALSMAAYALYQLGSTFRYAVAIALVKLIAPSLERDVDISVGAAAVLAQLIFLESSPRLARSLRSNLMELTNHHLQDDHDYIWMKVGEVAELLNLE